MNQSEEFQEPAYHILPLLISALLCGLAAWERDMEGVVYSLLLGGGIGVILFERIRVKHLQTGCSVLKTSLFFLILLLGCKWAADLLAFENLSWDTLWYGITLVLALFRYRWYLPRLIRRRAGLMNSASR
ncbi:hypothetical protein FYJ85_21340 [Victivallaceae bacterium BBE-744-WT-12]|uniref:Uncharacterized protein n=1 Tax=Victivallis lenta TaxID=2606640 RepID=A0A844G881_9BACT|nr:hypothetical protein [Victivallis lenta]MST99576.1 hypothetical protein [Victivallis lenta]